MVGPQLRASTTHSIPSLLFNIRTRTPPSAFPLMQRSVVPVRPGQVRAAWESYGVEVWAAQGRKRRARLLFFLRLIMGGGLCGGRRPITSARAYNRGMMGWLCVGKKTREAPQRASWAVQRPSTPPDGHGRQRGGSQHARMPRWVSCGGWWVGTRVAQRPPPNLHKIDRAETRWRWPIGAQ